VVFYQCKIQQLWDYLALSHFYPWIVYSRERRLWLVEDEEGGQVGGVGGDNDHSEAGPHHPKDARGKAAWSAYKEEED
jgi:hypothetical protein